VAFNRRMLLFGMTSAELFEEKKKQDHVPSNGHVVLFPLAKGDV
jgi:hypothetical protein